MDVIEKLWKEYKKSTQKIKTTAISHTLMNKQSKLVNSTEKESQEQIKQAKSTTGEATKGLQQSVKGQFGKKVTEVLTKQEKTLNTL